MVMQPASLILVSADPQRGGTSAKFPGRLLASRRRGPDQQPAPETKQGQPRRRGPEGNAVRG
ncbi:hypothetical protein BJV77DRAFT_1021659 [Russula vinacea]|nr:hypothetical protein BJV77DRAFT_1021659 [Russula vinacea]